MASTGSSGDDFDSDYGFVVVAVVAAAAAADADKLTAMISARAVRYRGYFGEEMLHEFNRTIKYDKSTVFMFHKVAALPLGHSCAGKHLNSHLQTHTHR